MERSLKDNRWYRGGGRGGAIVESVVNAVLTVSSSSKLPLRPNLHDTTYAVTSSLLPAATRQLSMTHVRVL